MNNVILGSLMGFVFCHYCLRINPWICLIGSTSGSIIVYFLRYHK